MNGEVSELELALYIYRNYKDSPEKLISYHDVERVFGVPETRAANLMYLLKKDGIIDKARSRGWLINRELLEPGKGEEYISKRLKRYTLDELQNRKA